MNNTVADIDKEYATHSAPRTRKQLQKLADHEQKLGNKIALEIAPRRNTALLKVLEDQDGAVTTKESRHMGLALNSPVLGLSFTS
jgi:hypothetical protein